MIQTTTSTFAVESRGSHVLMARGGDAAPDNRPPRYACHRCGATSYRALMARGLDGAMRASGRYACTGCRLEFGQVAQWMGAAAETA